MRKYWSNNLQIQQIICNFAAESIKSRHLIDDLANRVKDTTVVKVRCGRIVLTSKIYPYETTKFKLQVLFG